MVGEAQEQRIPGKNCFPCVVFPKAGFCVGEGFISDESISLNVNAPNRQLHAHIHRIVCITKTQKNAKYVTYTMRNSMGAVAMKCPVGSGHVSCSEQESF